MHPNKPLKTTQPVHATAVQSFEGRVTVNQSKTGRLLRLPDVESVTGLKKSSIYAGMKARTFPVCVRLSSRAVGWRESDIELWVAGRASMDAQP